MILTSHTRSLVRARRLHMLALAFFAMALPACAQFGGVMSFLFPAQARPVVLDSYRLQPGSWHPGHLVAGAARVDITPPVGYPTGGHGPAGGFARAYWTRLYARAFFFADSSGRPLVLVSCDLFALPGGLATRVARNVAQQWQSQGLSISPDAVIIAATHTHHGPGNFLTSPTYNDFGSKYGGFDRELFDFLEHSITQAVNAAITDAMHSGPASLALRTGHMPDTLLLNRSPQTFLANWNAQALLDRLHPDSVACSPDRERGEARASGWDLPGCPRRRAADPTATVLTVTRGGHDVAALVFLGVHPTVLEHGAPMYNSDFTGVAVSSIERRHARAGDSIVVGFFNGTEGDVVASRGERDLRAVRAAAATFENSLDALIAARAAPLAATSIMAHRALLKPGERYRTSIGEIGLPRTATFGTAAMGGAEDDRTIFYTLGWREGMNRIPNREQGLKLPALDSDLLPLELTTLFVPREAFPRLVPLTMAQLGSLRIAAVPFEMSTAQGLHIRDALGDHEHLAIIGLANEYASYTATADEFSVQDYMAASTIWGPQQGAVITATLRCLDRSLLDRSQCAALLPADSMRVAGYRYKPGRKAPTARSKNHLGASWTGDSLAHVDDGFTRVLLDRTGGPARALPYFEWTEDVDRSLEFTAAARRRVEILEQQAGQWQVRRTAQGVPDDDGGSNFLTVLRQGRSAANRGADVHRWAAIWLAGALEDATPRGTYKFRVTTLHDNAPSTFVESCPFTLASVQSDRSALRTNCAQSR